MATRTKKEQAADSTAKGPASAEVKTLDQLEQRVDELLVLTQMLSKENKALRTQQKNWSTERARLIEKNELAKGKVESMISRLKALEQD